MDSEDFGRESRFGVSRTANVVRDSVEAFAGVFWWGGDGSGDNRGGSSPCHCRGDFCDGVFGAFHHVVAAGAVNVHVNETGDDNLVAGRVMFSVRWHAHFVAMADLRDLAVFDDDHAVYDFFVGREDAAGVNGCRGHGSNMLTELGGKNTSEPCILFLLRYNRCAPNLEGIEWHMTSGM